MPRLGRGIPATYGLRPPLVGPGLVNPPIDTRLVRGRPGRPYSRLFPPAVVTQPAAQPLAPPVRVSTTRIRPRPVRSRLNPPAVVIPVPTAPPVRVALTRIRPSRTTASLRPPLVGPGVVSPPVETRLARSARPQTRSKLSPPVVVVPVPLAPPGKPKLVRGRPGKPLSRLSPPAVVSPAGFIAPPIDLRLVRASRPQARSKLSRPVVVGAQIFPPFRGILTSFASAVQAAWRIRQLRPSKGLGVGQVAPPPPADVNQLPTFFSNAVQAAVTARRKRTLTGLRAPIVTPAAIPEDSAGFLSTSLAPRRPTVTHPARQPHSRLRPPVVVGVQVFPVLENQRRLRVTLALQARLRRLRRTISVLRKPTVVSTPPPVLHPIAITLAPARLPQRDSAWRTRVTLWPPRVLREPSIKTLTGVCVGAPAVLVGVCDTVAEGLYPPFYPGAGVYPGSALVLTPDVSVVLPTVCDPNYDPLYPPFYPGPAVYPGHGSTLYGTPVTTTPLTGDPI